MIAEVFVALYAAHMVGDHWVQTSHQAAVKGGPGWSARLANVRHVAGLTLTKLIALVAMALATGVGYSMVPLIAGLTVDAVSHYWADRRTTLAQLAERLGLGGFYRLGGQLGPNLGTGAHALDQSWHIGWLFVAALIIGGSW